MINKYKIMWVGIQWDYKIVNKYAGQFSSNYIFISFIYM